MTEKFYILASYYDAPVQHIIYGPYNREKAERSAFYWPVKANISILDEFTKDSYIGLEGIQSNIDYDRERLWV